MPMKIAEQIATDVAVLLAEVSSSGTVRRIGRREGNRR
jgi:hypothetical protein